MYDLSTAFPLSTTHSVYAPRYSTRRAELRRFRFWRKGHLRSSGLSVTLNIGDHCVAFMKHSSSCPFPHARVVRDCDAVGLIFSLFFPTWICPTLLSMAERAAQ